MDEKQSQSTVIGQPRLRGKQDAMREDEKIDGDILAEALRPADRLAAAH
jgi:hypothetical protein